MDSSELLEHRTQDENKQKPQKTEKLSNTDTIKKQEVNYTN